MRSDVKHGKIWSGCTPYPQNGFEERCKYAGTRCCAVGRRPVSSIRHVWTVAEIVHGVGVRLNFFLRAQVMGAQVREAGESKTASENGGRGPRSMAIDIHCTILHVIEAHLTMLFLLTSPIALVWYVVEQRMLYTTPTHTSIPTKSSPAT